MAKKTPVIEIKKDRRFLMTKLTADEVAAAADDVARYLDDLTGLEAELTTVKSQFKARIEQCEANIAAKARLVREKKEIRPVDVEERYDMTECTLTVVRLDTGELIEERPLTGNEKQMKITELDGSVVE